MPKLKQSFLTIVIGLTLVAGISYAWTGPTANPPLNNAPAPINVSALSQIKDGALQVNGFRNIGDSYISGSVGIGVSPIKTAKLYLKAGNNSNDPYALRIEQGIKPLKNKVLTAVDDSGNAEWMPSQSFNFGGFYTTNYLEGTCRYGNPYTGGCSCPSGFSSSQIDDFINPPCTSGFYADGGVRKTNCGVAMYQCYKK